MKSTVLCAVLMLIALGATIIAGPVQAYSSNSLGVQLISQWTDVSCWAAAGTMVIGYYSHMSMSHGFATKVQQALAYYMSGNTYGLTHGIPLTFFQKVLGNYASAMAQFSVQMTPVYGSLSFNTVVSEIDGGHPIILLIQVSPNNGHAIVIAGYQQSGSKVLIYDPWPPNVGATYWQTFSTFQQQAVVSSFKTSAAFDFSVSNSGGFTVTRGSSGQTRITATLLSGSAQSVSLSCSGLPSVASCNFIPLSGNPTFSSTLTLKTSASTPKGSYTITVTATGGGKSHTTQFTLTVK